MPKGNCSRREFLKNLVLAGTGLAVAPAGLNAVASGFSEEKSSGVSAQNFAATRPRPNGAKSVAALTNEPTQIVRVGVIGLGFRGFGFLPNNAETPLERCADFGWLGEVLKIPFARVTALCDSVPARAEKAARLCALKRPDVPAPRVFTGTENAWENLCEADDVDVIYIAAPQAARAEMAIRAMAAGKHVFVETPAATTLEECWDLVDASELAQRHCALLENCSFGDDELILENMVRGGVFGELTHAECAYENDLREWLFRNATHRGRDADGFCPAHGLAPVFRLFGIYRGEDAPDFLVAVNALKIGQNGGETILIKTARGRVILLQPGAASPRPYSRLKLLAGTNAVFAGFPARLALEAPEKFGVSARSPHAWLDEKEFEKIRRTFRHPLWRDFVGNARRFGRGGTDYVMNFRLLDCIRKGITPELTVYDVAACSCVADLAAHSAASGSAPITFPDFMREISSPAAGISA